MASEYLRAISSPIRLEILHFLYNQEFCVDEIVIEVGTSHSNISHHLSILKGKGIVETRKSENRVYYRINNRKILRLLKLLQELFSN